MWNKAVLLSTLLFLGASLAPDLVFAQPRPSGPLGPCEYRGMPYGHFCPGRGRGPYGASRPVRTLEEAKQVVDAYFSSLGEGIGTGKIEERRLFFEVEILNKEGSLIDKAIVDKRTGRIRSIY
jgi:hypothetical protein